MWLDGKDLRKEPQIERKRLLKELTDKHKLEEPIYYSEHHEGGRAGALRCRQQVEL
ncbi:hypothetical protein [Bradyrhizobium sp. CB2312]|uniref:hypothetical protein n=1 Tax=Bradyrhizobium sp. CB2312 TaxID=3039155 RepID=UPI0024B0CCCF|nr:hypothetical protein [Bradyrhizobium sp. CB2312]WFU76982.1 hypothetical protein QA642_17355 [Bradyrhizobium sp. CB2312]